METDWTSEWAPPPRNLPELDAETLAAVRDLQGGGGDHSTRHIFEIFEPQLGAYFRRHGCQDAEADDLTQNVFLRMLEQIGTLKDAKSFHFWLFKIAGNHFRNFLRARARDREGLEDFADLARKESESSAFWVRGTFEPSPEAQLTISETVDRRRLLLSKLLRATKLAPQTRRSLLLRLRGDSYQEIARTLGIAVGTVGSHVSRASAVLLKNLEEIDLDEVAAADAGDDDVAELSAELLTFKREALEADPAYSRAGILEAGSANNEAAEEREELPPTLFAAEDSKEKTKTRRGARATDSPAEIAAVARQDRRRGRPRRRGRRTILPAGKRDLEPDLGRLDRDDLGYPLILLEEVAARYGERGESADSDLALKAKLSCAGALLARGRRFSVARRAGEIVRQAIVLIGNGQSGELRRAAMRRDAIHHKVVAGRSLLESYLDRN